MKRTINANGFVNRTPKQTPVLLLIIALLIVLFLFRWFYNPYKKVSVIAPKRAKIEQADSICIADRIILNKLCPILKKREGFRSKIYSDEKGNFYLGYGHLLTEIDNLWLSLNFNYNITEHQADSILRDDLRKCYFERMRILRKTEQEDIFSIFTSGHLGYNGK